MEIEAVVRLLSDRFQNFVFELDCTISWHKDGGTLHEHPLLPGWQVDMRG